MSAKRIRHVLFNLKNYPVWVWKMRPNICFAKIRTFAGFVGRTQWCRCRCKQKFLSIFMAEQKVRPHLSASLSIYYLIRKWFFCRINFLSGAFVWKFIVFFYFIFLTICEKLLYSWVFKLSIDVVEQLTPGRLFVHV